MSEDDDAASVAAARRQRKRAPSTSVSPTPPAAPVTDPGAPPVLEKLAPPEVLSVSRSVVAEHMLRTDGIRMFGDRSLYPAVIPPGTISALTGEYVQAACDAHETMVPPRAKSSVSRTLWRKGWLVRRDVYEAVLAAHAAAVAAGTVGEPVPASLDAPPLPIGAPASI